MVFVIIINVNIGAATLYVHNTSIYHRFNNLGSNLEMKL